MKVTPWEQSNNQPNPQPNPQLRMLAALAAARIHINKITPIGFVEVRPNDALRLEENVGIVTMVAVSYEFQWKHRGSYTWEKMVGAYHIFLPESVNVQEVQTLQVQAQEAFTGVQEQVYADVIRARAELEDPNDRGEYTYYATPITQEEG